MPLLRRCHQHDKMIRSDQHRIKSDPSTTSLEGGGFADAKNFTKSMQYVEKNESNDNPNVDREREGMRRAHLDIRRKRRRRRTEEEEEDGSKLLKDTQA